MSKRYMAVLAGAGIGLALSGCSALLAPPSADVGEWVNISDLPGAVIDEIPTVDYTETHDGEVVRL